MKEGLSPSLVGAERYQIKSVCASSTFAASAFVLWLGGPVVAFLLQVSASFSLAFNAPVGVTFGLAVLAAIVTGVIKPFASVVRAPFVVVAVMAPIVAMDLAPFVVSMVSVLVGTAVVIGWDRRVRVLVLPPAVVLFDPYKVHGVAAGMVTAAIPTPVAGLFLGHMEVDDRCVIGGSSDDHGLCIPYRWRRVITQRNLPINAGRKGAAKGDVCVALRMCSARQRQAKPYGNPSPATASHNL